MAIYENYFYRYWVVNGLCPTALALISIEWEAVWAREPVWRLCWWRKHLISTRNRSPVLQPLAVDFTDEANPAREISQLVPDVQRSPPPLSTLYAFWNIEDENDAFLRCVEKHWICQRSITYLLTPWCRVLIEKLTGLQLVKKFPAFHGTRRFITAFTSVRHLSLSWASPIKSIYPHPTSWRSVLILSTHLCLGLPSGLFPSGFPT